MRYLDSKRTQEDGTIRAEIIKMVRLLTATLLAAGCVMVNRASVVR
jgi:hypothetical protein